MVCILLQSAIVYEHLSTEIPCITFFPNEVHNDKIIKIACILQIIKSEVTSKIFQCPVEIGQNNVKTWGCQRWFVNFPVGNPLLKGTERDFWLLRGVLICKSIGMAIFHISNEIHGENLAVEYPIWTDRYGGSENRGNFPQFSSILVAFSLINHPF